MLPSRLVQAVYTAALLSSSLYGQTTTGTLLGTVSDPDNAAVPGAVVELRNPSTGLAMRTNTGAEGIFRFNSLAPATYDPTVTAAAGFKAYSSLPPTFPRNTHGRCGSKASCSKRTRIWADIPRRRTRGRCRYRCDCSFKAVTSPHPTQHARLPRLLTLTFTA